jgi:hypothetical protein
MFRRDSRFPGRTRCIELYAAGSLRPIAGFTGLLRVRGYERIRA